jgi:hypothetical protein
MGVECSALQYRKAKCYIDTLGSIKINNAQQTVLQGLLPRQMSVYSDDSYVLLINIIFSIRSSLRQKMEEVFKLFDINFKNCLSKDELFAMIHYLYRAYHNYLQKTYTYEQAQQYIQTNMTILNHKAAITFRQFYSNIRANSTLMSTIYQLKLHSFADEKVQISYRNWKQ